MIKNISLEYWPSRPNIWMKTPESIQTQMPAVAALIRIGPDACKAVISASDTLGSIEDRLAAVLVVSQVAATMKNPDEERAFLGSTLGEANLLRSWAEKGLQGLKSHQ